MEDKSHKKENKPISLIRLEGLVRGIDKPFHKTKKENKDTNRKGTKRKEMINIKANQKIINNRKEKEINNRKEKEIKNNLKKKKANHKKVRESNFSHLLYFPFVLTYLELILHLLIYKNIDKYLFFIILFTFPVGIILGSLTRMFHKGVNIVLTWVFTSLASLIFISQYVYFKIFKTYLSTYSIGAVGTDVLEFTSQMFTGIKESFIGILLLILPLIVLALIRGKIIFNRKKIEVHILTIMTSILLQIVLVLMLGIYGKGSYSPYDLYHNTWIQDMSVERLGLLTTTRKDIGRLVTSKTGNSLDLDKLPVGEGEGGGESKPPSTEAPSNNDNIEGQKPEEVEPTPTPPIIDTSPNTLDIDFAALAEKETNSKLKDMHEYFNQVSPTLKNEYTGMFEGYNLIFLTAEGFSPWAVHKELTPTLYKLINEGFVFNNFYTPLWWASTIDGEYVATTSLIPKSGTISYTQSANNFMPFAFGNQFAKLGYSTRAYHNHTYTYYDRHISYPNMGYDYKGVGNGLNVTKVWPESDLEMMEETIPEYIKDQPFHTYYMTVSGHMNYTFAGNSMSTKNRAKVDHLAYSDESKAYIACNIELDKALEKLLKELEENDLADKTVIALSADHYPYGLDKKHIDELAGHEVEENFELYKNNFILWSASIEEPIVIDKASSSLDIIPTLSNLFGLDYDSRLFIGQDILSDSDPLVVFSNRSFITDKIMYNSRTGKVTNLTEEEVSKEYIEKMNNIVQYKFLISENILDLDYYSHIGIK